MDTAFYSGRRTQQNAAFATLVFVKLHVYLYRLVYMHTLAHIGHVLCLFMWFTVNCLVVLISL